MMRRRVFRVSDIAEPNKVKKCLYLMLKLS